LGIRHFVLNARNPGPWTGGGNNTFLLPGRVTTLIDAGVGDAAHLDEIEARLADTDSGGGPLARVIVTHGHSDHVSGVSALADRWPGATFHKMPWPGRDERWSVQWNALADDEPVDAGDLRLRVVYTPGHAPDHISLYDEESRTLFCGDLVVAGSTVVIPGGRGGDLAAYLRSLERVIALQPLRLLPAHGAAIEDPASVLHEYLEHRRLREAQILELLGPGPATPESLLERMYRGLRPELREAALGSVLAHLFKLRDEGRAEVNEGHWRLR
jgi:glyoxylase-like metal-dependent hydrolase (beta-lactamase superfamily II)